MSAYVDRFIKQHKEYFKRNESFIKNNTWNDSSAFDDQIDVLTDNLVSLNKDLEQATTKKKRESLEKQITEVKKEIAQTTHNNQENKSKLFSQENDLTTSIVGRLSAFIKSAEESGDRGLSKVQKFIDFTVDIIFSHIEKCDDYLDYNMDVLEEEADEDYKIDIKGKEITFQDTVFKKKIGIQDKLDDLNIHNDINKIRIKFFKDEKAAIPMMSVLPLYSNEVRKLTEQLDIPSEIYDLEFYIHKLERGDKIPEWDDKKHYWEQDPETLKFWYNEWIKINKGFTVDGYYFHPWLYYHLNFYKTAIPQEDDTEPIINPMLRDNEWYIAELLKKAEEVKNRGICLFGSRRFAKSVTMSSICEWKALIKDNATTAITSGSEGDLSELTHKIKTSMKFKVSAFKLPIQKQEWDGGVVELGLKADQQTLLEHSRHTIKNLAAGSKKSSQKTAGGAPSVFLIEEIGKMSWEKAYLAAIPSFETPYGFKTTVIAVGTSGESSLVGDALKAVSNPKSFKFLEMDWDMFEEKIPKGAVTWKRRTFASFVPGQMGYKTGFKRIPRPFGQFLGIKSEFLDKVTIHQTDWETNTKVIKADREAVKNDPLKHQQEVVQFPIDPEECFLSSEKNPFPAMEAKKHKEHLESVGNVGRAVDLYRDENGKVKWLDSTKKYPMFPFPGGNHDSPVTIYEMPPEEPDIGNNLYIAGLDGYKHDTSDGDSLGSMVIFKRNIMDEWSDRIVASYHSRPDDMKDFNKNCLMLMEMYGARCFPENEDMSIKDYLDRRHITDKYLLQGFDFLSELDLNNTGNRKYGWQPTPKNKQYLIGKAINYTKEEFLIEGVKEEDNKVILGIQKIPDLKILEEIINYNSEGNFDGITSFMSALAYSHYLDSNYVSPNVRQKRQEEEKRKPRKSPSRGFTKTRFSMWK